MTWILLRGLTRESRHWGAFPALFGAALGADAPARAIDLPGNGALHGLRSPTRIEAMTAWCRGELQRQGVVPPYRLLAMSLGAMVAVDWACRHPHELACGVLINTSLRPFSPVHQRLRPASVPSLLRLLLTDPPPVKRERAVWRLTSRQAAPPDALLNDWETWREQCPVSRANALRQLLAAARFVAPLARPSPRLLVLASTHDALVDARCSRQLAQAWQVPLAEHPGAGHDLPLDDAAWVAGQVRRWLQR